MKNKWQKFVYPTFLAVGITVGLITNKFLVIFAISSIIGLIAHFVVGYFLLPKNDKKDKDNK